MGTLQIRNADWLAALDGLGRNCARRTLLSRDAVIGAVSLSEELWPVASDADAIPNAKNVGDRNFLSRVVRWRKS